MAVTLADGSTVHNSSAIDVSIHLFGQSVYLDLSVRYSVLEHLFSDLVFAMDWLWTYNPVIDQIGSALALCANGVSITIGGIAAGQRSCLFIQVCSLHVLLWMMRHNKIPAWFALLHDEYHSVIGRLGSLLSGEGARTANSSSQPTTQWDLLYNDYADMFETPSGLPDHKIKYWIDLIDQNAQPPKQRQYRMSNAELMEVLK